MGRVNNYCRITRGASVSDWILSAVPVIAI